MLDFIFDEIDFSPQITSFQGIHLWVIHAEKIPPHIGLSIDNYYFSLKANGRDDAIQVNSILQIISKKEIGTLLIKLKSNTTLNQMKAEFDKFESAQDLNSTCLVPIKRCLNAPKKILKLSDLLHYLKAEGEILSVFGLHLNNDYKGIEKYSTIEIQQRITKLKQC